MNGRDQVKCIHETFEDQVRLTPGAIAIEFEKSEITFAELKKKADVLASRLKQAGATSGEYVALMVDRSPEMIAAVLGILKCGAAFVPLDTSGPTERTRHMILDADVKIVLSSMPALGPAIGDTVTVIQLESNSTDNYEEAPTSGRTYCDINQPAYVIYTSGSTGPPKGVVATHSSLMNGLNWMWHSYPFQKDEVCCYTRSQLNLIDSIWEIFLPLLNGVRLSILPEHVLRDPLRLVEALRERGITRIALVPSLLRLLMESCVDLGFRLPNLKLWMSSGEPLRVDLANEFLRVVPQGRLLNLYGLSEAPDVTYFEVRVVQTESSIPIGSPVANTTVFVLDDEKSLVPEGHAGELHVGGPGLAMGYLARPALTAERFIPDGFGSHLGGRLYNTGDLAMYGTDGNLEILGRKDLQVNIHGFRVELGEVEVAISQHPDINQVVVIARDHQSESKTLAAYLRSKTNRQVGGHELRAFLKDRLPSYMIPTEFVQVDSIPFTRSGKVDRLALSQIRGCDDSNEFVEPRDVIELQVAQMWQDVLKVGPIGVFDDFFELGGDSLTAISLVCRIEEQLGEKVPLSLVLEASTVASLSEFLKEKKGSLPHSRIVPIRKTGSRPPLFLVHGVGGEVLEFHDLATHLGPDQPVYALQAPMTTESAQESKSIEEVATGYREAIQEVWPEGPYLIGGYSWGGIVAFEIAQQLQRRNKRIHLLAILDTDLQGTFQTPEKISDLTTLLKDREHLLLTPQYLSILDRDGQFREELQRLESALAQEGITEEFGDAYRRKYAAGFIARIRAFSSYNPDTFTGQITLVLSSESNFADQWSDITTLTPDVLKLPATHLGILRGPSVQKLAKHLTYRIDPHSKPQFSFPSDQGSEASTALVETKKQLDEEMKDTRYKVVVNHEMQYSIWPADRANALGWKDGGKLGTKEECLGFVAEVWDDIRPLSIKRAQVRGK